MNLARVIGTVWATHKVEHADGASLQLIQPLTAELAPLGEPLAACDTVGAGPGELVFYVTAYEAVIPFVTRPGGPGLGTLVPMDAAIVGIVEQLVRSDAYMPGAAPAGSPAHPERSAAKPKDSNKKKGGRKRGK